jgi:hypothetical protein
MIKEGIEKGTRVIFTESSGTLHGRPGEVFTFSNWLRPGEFFYWQSVELLELGYDKHNITASCVEIFDPAAHKDFKEITPQEIMSQRQKFIDTYGE